MRPYRGLTKDGKWIKGWFVSLYGFAYIVPEDAITLCGEAVIPETVGQYTSLTDIEKEDIYAGDKLETSNWGIVTVEWSETKAMFGFWYKSNWGKGWCQFWKVQGFCKVIGNVHQEVKI